MRRLPFAIALLMLASAATAQVYKWTDSHGTVHYSESPPASNVRYTKLDSLGLPRGDSAPAPKAVPAVDSAPAPSSTAPMPDTPQNRKALCQSLESNLSVLKGKGPVLMQDNGKATPLDQAQRDRQTAQTQAQYQQYCSQ